MRAARADRGARTDANHELQPPQRFSSSPERKSPSLIAGDTFCDNKGTAATVTCTRVCLQLSAFRSVGFAVGARVACAVRPQGEAHGRP